jgi:hypothetical protein
MLLAQDALLHTLVVHLVLVGVNGISFSLLDGLLMISQECFSMPLITSKIFQTL